MHASGGDVGLQDGKPGNSEAGHNNLGAGRIVAQDDVRMDAAIKDDPLLEKPRYYATRFVSNLEAVDALSWEPGWHITEAGRKGLALLEETAEQAGEER